MDAPRPERFEFGGFRLDRRRRLLVDESGTPLHVTPKAFDTLAYFLEHPGQVIERSTLLEFLWPNTVREENNLRQAVASLRRLLGHGFIVSVSGRGYQFVADVRVVGEEDTSPAVNLPVSSSAPGAHWRYTAGLVFALAAIGGLYLLPGVPSRPVALSDVRPNSLAVLPLVNLTRDHGDEFADGLTEELINRLARVKSLDVTARTSSFAFKRAEKDVAAIARDLGVHYVLEGSVARGTDRLRVQVQLVDAVTGSTVWSEAFDRGVQDTLVIQEDIAAATAKALLGPLGLDNDLVSASGSKNVEAYELYLAARARSHLTPEDVSRGLEQIDRALVLDPDFALAWSQKARLLNRNAVLQAGPLGEAQAAAEQAAVRAITVEPNLGFAHTALAASLMTRGDRARADAEFKQGIALGSWEDAEIYGLFLLSVGHVSRAREHLMAVRARDPLNPDVSAWIAATYDSLGESAAALAELERGRRLFDRWQSGLNIEMLTRLGIGHRDVVRVVPELYPALAPLWKPFEGVVDLLEDPDKATPELRALYSKPGVPQGHVLAVAAMLGQPEFAVERFIELTKLKAGAGSSSGILWAHVFRDMRRLPRFKELVRQEGLVRYWKEAGWPDLCRPAESEEFECF